MARIGDYELVGKVAETAASTVWKARDVHLERYVALKRLRPGLDATFLEREARVLGSLDHPNIVRVHDIFTAGGSPYLVEDWVEGASLGAVRDQSGRLSTEQALGVTRDALLGLAYAHDQQVIHGDISPGNVLIDLAGVSKLVDFGAASLDGDVDGLGSDVDGEAGRSLFGLATRYGTAGFRSPEVAAGAIATKRSDVYSVGALLVDLLSTSALAAASPGPSALAGAQPAIRAVLTKALAADPAARQSDAGALLGELEVAAERSLGAGWLAVASMSGLVSATVGGTATAVLGAGGTAGTAVAAEAAHGGIATVAGWLTRIPKTWLAVGSGAAVTAAAVVVTTMLVAHHSALPVAAGPSVSSAVGARSTSSASRVASSTRLSRPADPSSSVGTSTATVTTSPAGTTKAAGGLAGTSNPTQPSSSGSRTTTSTKGVGLNGTYRATFHTTKAVGQSVNVLGDTKVYVWKVQSACTDGHCSATARAPTGTYVFTNAGSKYVWVGSSTGTCRLTSGKAAGSVSYPATMTVAATFVAGTVQSLKGDGHTTQANLCPGQTTPLSDIVVTISIARTGP